MSSEEDSYIDQNLPTGSLGLETQNWIRLFSQFAEHS